MRYHSAIQCAPQIVLSQLSFPSAIAQSDGFLGDDKIDFSVPSSHLLHHIFLVRSSRGALVLSETLKTTGAIGVIFCDPPIRWEILPAAFCVVKKLGTCHRVTGLRLVKKRSLIFHRLSHAFLGPTKTQQL